ncbi:MAG: hypothetical protein ACLFUF_08610 [Opitutales bacterium]
MRSSIKLEPGEIKTLIATVAINPKEIEALRKAVMEFHGVKIVNEEVKCLCGDVFLHVVIQVEDRCPGILMYVGRLTKTFLMQEELAV